MIFTEGLLMSDENKQLRQDIMATTEHPHTICDQGPVLVRIVDRLERLDEHAENTKNFQKEMSGALITIAAQQERLVAIADKTDSNKDDINSLFKINRENERRLNDHINNHSAPISLNKTNPDGSLSKAKKWDMLTMSLFTGAALGAAGFIWKLVEKAITP